MVIEDEATPMLSLHYEKCQMPVACRGDAAISNGERSGVQGRCAGIAWRAFAELAHLPGKGARHDDRLAQLRNMDSAHRPGGWECG